MRNNFAEALYKEAKQNDKICVVVADISPAGSMQKFRTEFPDRFINLGICEQSLISVASGIALEGMKPWVYTITPFLIEGPFEQIKLDINQQKANVKLVGFSDYPTLGPTHSELNAIKLMNLFKNIKSFFPKNSYETKILTKKCQKLKSPCFISLKSDPLIQL